MAKQVQLRRGDASDHETFTGAIGELTYVSDDKTLRIHDGSTAGGINVLAGVGSMNIRQIVSATYDVTAGTSHALTDPAQVSVYGMSVTITPKTTSSTLLLIWTPYLVSVSANDITGGTSHLVTGNTAAAGAATDGTHVSGSAAVNIVRSEGTSTHEYWNKSTNLTVTQPASTSEVRYDVVAYPWVNSSSPTYTCYPQATKSAFWCIEIG